MGYFDQQANVKVGGQGTYLTKGMYRVKVQKMLVKDNSGVLVIFEFEVVSSDNPDHPVGSTRSWTAKILGGTPKQVSAAQSNLNRFLIAALGYKPDTEEANSVITQSPKIFQEGLDKGIFNGTLLDLEVTTIKKNDGGDFNKHTFSPVKG